MVWSDPAFLREKVRGMMTPQRWQHVEGVVETAKGLARRFGVDEERAALAALLHDAARDWPEPQLRRWAERAATPPDPVERTSPELLHGPVAAEWAGAELGVEDRAVLDAVRYHTTGRPGMTRLEMVLMVADYGEPGRSFPEAEAIRRAARTHLEEACLLSLDARLRYLLDGRLPIHPRTVETRNWLLLDRAGGLRG